MPEKYFSISEAAQLTHLTSETLRHYDRIGLVKPAHVAPDTGYRYYSRQDLVRLNTVHALRCMDLSLSKIKAMLVCDDLTKIVVFLSQAACSADEKIAALQDAKARIQAAKAAYESKLPDCRTAGTLSIRSFPQRVLLLSDHLEQPTLDNLWNYLRTFYDQVAPSSRDAFTFADMAGIYTAEGYSRMFALCTHYPALNGLTVLPAGEYLCADCTEKDRFQVLAELTAASEMKTGRKPAFTVQQVVVSGILQWTYQVQVPV